MSAEGGKFFCSRRRRRPSRAQKCCTQTRRSYVDGWKDAQVAWRAGSKDLVHQMHAVATDEIGQF